jgi:hypothetical protein
VRENQNSTPYRFCNAKERQLSSASPLAIEDSELALEMSRLTRSRGKSARRGTPSLCRWGSATRSRAGRLPRRFP